MFANDLVPEAMDGPQVTRELARLGWTADWEYPGFIGVSPAGRTDVYLTVGNLDGPICLQVMTADGSDCLWAEDVTPYPAEDVERLNAIADVHARQARAIADRMQAYLDSHAPRRDAPGSVSTTTTPPEDFRRG